MPKITYFIVFITGGWDSGYIEEGRYFCSEEEVKDWIAERINDDCNEPEDFVIYMVTLDQRRYASSTRTVTLHEEEQ